MRQALADKYRKIWAFDFEYRAPDGELPECRCLVAIEVTSGKEVRVWFDDHTVPFPEDFDPINDLFLAFYASAELGCFKVLGWPDLKNVIDLYLEAKVAFNGRKFEGVYRRGSLLGVMQILGLSAISSYEKEKWRDLIMEDRRSVEYSDNERRNIFDYCRDDCEALQSIFNTRLHHLINSEADVYAALYRGRYMRAVASMEHRGVPLDAKLLHRLKDNWEGIRVRLVEEIDRDYNIYDGTTFKKVQFEAFLIRNDIPWPRLPETGASDLKSETFRQQARGNNKIAPLHELRQALSELKLNKIGCDDYARHRCLLSPMGTKTGRHNTSNSKWVFGPSRWIRSLIKPPAGYSVGYADWSSQEHWISGQLSGDKKLIEAYAGGDVYLAFGRLSGFLPMDATKATHKAERHICKGVVLGVSYGMREHSLASRIGVPLLRAKELLLAHKTTYSTFWEWTEQQVDLAILNGSMRTRLGWKFHVTESNRNSLQNWPMQAHGADCLRLAMIMCEEQDIEICAPVHDAILFQAPTHRFETVSKQVQATMVEAARIAIGADPAYPVRVDVDRVSYPDRFEDEGGTEFFERVMKLLEEVENNE